MSELAKRWAVAAAGVPAVLVLLYFGGWLLAVPVAGLAALGARELYGMAEQGGVRPLSHLGAGAAATLVLLAAWRPALADFAPLALGLVAATGAVALVAALKVRGPGGRPLAAVGVTLFGVGYVGLTLAVVPLLHGLPGAWGGSGVWGGLVVVALPLAATWLGDALAFFAGSAWGQGGLAPSISPKKSWVGVWAGLFGAGLAGVVWYFVARMIIPELPVGGVMVSVCIGVLLGVAAILGDLVESLFKRESGIKDSGTFFPGHGGILDRLDALVFSLPSAYVALLVVGAP